MTKQEVLEEIRRTAAVNGGTPLGVRRFEAETGIKETAWSGRYWARWADALAEAGFSANQMQQPFDEPKLVAHLVDLARQLGRVPTSRDLRMRRKADPSFPTDVVFSRRWSRDEMVAVVVRFCGDQPDLVDVRKIFEAATGHNSKVRGLIAEEPVLGVVYLLKSGRHYKIGHTNSIGRREYEVALQLPEKVKTVHAIKTDDPPGIEAYWHRRFAEKRANGEWFALDAEDVAAFKRRKTM